MYMALDKIQKVPKAIIVLSNNDRFVKFKENGKLFSPVNSGEHTHVYYPFLAYR